MSHRRRRYIDDWGGDDGATERQQGQLSYSFWLRRCGAGDHRVREIAGRAGSIVGARELAPTTRASVAVNRSGKDDPAHTRLRVHHPKTDCAVCLSASYAIAPQVGRHGYVGEADRCGNGTEGHGVVRDGP
jgi:hypothetical protein